MITVEKRGAVAWLRFVNPPHGFMTTAQLAMLHRTINRLERDDSVRVIVIAGDAPGRFIAHTEIDQIREMLDGTPRLPRALIAWMLRVAVLVLRILPPLRLPMPLPVLLGFSAVERSRRITVAAIDGPCVGGGLELALCCDFRVASDSSDPIGCPEILIGMTPGFGGTHRLPRVIGARAAKELLLAGELIAPREALRLGLISRLVDKSRFDEEVHAFTQKLARRSPRAVAAMKRAIASQSPYVELAGLAELAHTPECRDGVARYSEILRRHLAVENPRLDRIAAEIDA